MKIKLNMYLKHNLGDDLFLKIILDRYPNHMFYIQTDQKYGKMLKKYKNVKIYNKYKSMLIRGLNILTNKNTFDYLKEKSDLMITLGGSLFQESNLNSKELKEQITKYLNKPHYIIGPNFGPYKHEFYKNSYKKMFKEANQVSFRDSYSYNLFKDLDIVQKYPDIVFNLDIHNIKEKEKKEVFISVMNLNDSYIEKMIEIINYYKKQKYKINLVSFCEYEGDALAIKKILKKVDDVNAYYYKDNIDEILKVMARSKIVIATRYHSIILGLLFNKIVIPFIYSDKALNTLKDLKFKGKIIDDNFKISDLDTDYHLNINNIKKEAKKHFKLLDKKEGYYE